MKFLCCHCHQKIEADASQAGITIACPACGGVLVIPSPPPANAPAIGRSAKPQRVSGKKKSGIASFVLPLLLLGICAASYVYRADLIPHVNRFLAKATSQEPKPSVPVTPPATVPEIPVAPEEPPVATQEITDEVFNLPDAAAATPSVEDSSLSTIPEVTPAVQDIPTAPTALVTPVPPNQSPSKDVGNALDTLVFGVDPSEAAHQLVATNSQVTSAQQWLVASAGTIGDNVGGGRMGGKTEGDHFFLRAQKLEGDGFIQARLFSSGLGDRQSKAGLMIREKLEPDSKTVFALDNSWDQFGPSVMTRSTNGGAASIKPFQVAKRPLWLRLERKGDVFTTRISEDGKEWREVGTENVSMDRTVYMGLTAVPQSQESLNSAIFDEILTSTPEATWSTKTVGQTDLAGKAELMGLGEPFRRLLPQEPANVYGGDLTFRMKVDPKGQNYCSVKLWGSEGGDLGRIVLTCEGKEIGQRHGAGVDIFIDQVGAVSPGAFWYRTTVLPKWLTEGKTSVEIRLRSTGKFYAYGKPWDYSRYQYPLIKATRGLYRFYTHSDPVLMPAATEVQGIAGKYPTAPKRPFDEEIEKRALQKHRDEINKRIADLMKKDSINRKDVEFLGDCLKVKWSEAYENTAVVSHLVKVIDSDCRKFLADPKTAGGEWGGGFGNQGAAVSIIAPLITRELAEPVDLGAGAKPRGGQWAAMLAASRDFGRFNRKTITNQIIFCDLNIYRANKGLLAMKSPEAFPEPQARRYLLEAAGLLPYSHSDLADGGSTWQMGKGVYAVTAKGTTHEWNWCCQDCYGRMGPEVYEMYLLSGDKAFLEKAVQMERAHIRLLYPAIDKAGYRAMLNESVICTRNVYHPGQVSYGDPQVAAASLDPQLLVGIRQQYEDGQMFNTWRHSPLTMFWPDDYERVKKAIAQVKGVLPATPGTGPFAWADEQNAVMVIKHGEELNFLTFARRSEQGYHGIGDVHSITPRFERVIQFAVEDIRYTGNGKFTIIGPHVQTPFTGTPPDNPVNAWEGQQWAQAEGRAGSPADFYGVRFGDFLIGMNCSQDKSFSFAPEGFRKGTDMISKKSFAAPVTVPAQTTVVFYAPLTPAP